MINILEEEDKHNQDLCKCKILFLKSQNDWMNQQKQFINLLIYKYKEIIQLSEKPQKERQINDQYHEINKIIHQKIKQYHKIKNIDFFWEQEMNNEEFLDIIQSFQDKILKLQQEIKHREKQLQEIEGKKIKEDNCTLRKNQSKWLHNIQTNRKLIYKVKNQVAQLKQKKRKLQNKIVAAGQNSPQSHETIKTRRYNSDTNEISTFEKALLVFKKKKYQNQVLQQKIKQLQNKIAAKKMISQKMKKEAENIEWKFLQGIQGGANGQIDSNYDYEFSVMDNSVCLQSMSFSFDISRFIKPRRIIRPF